MLRLSFMKRCQCNGHSNVCDAKTGSGCQCERNTVSDLSCEEGCFAHQVFFLDFFFVPNPVTKILAWLVPVFNFSFKTYLLFHIIYYRVLL